ncbi:MAG TPA: tape measure protein [Tepidisphaeraceae bacterium]|jgi:tape measure domain-containing protein|nr:tape measure protein [Tepidisphaeraceae bacterium]
MAKNISSLWVGLTGNVSGLSKSFGGAIGTIKGLAGSVAGAGGKLLALTGIGAGVAGAFAAVKGAASGISLAADLEQTGVAFETMLGSADAAGAMMEQLKSFAASTPFEFPEIANATKSLLNAGVGAGEMTDKLRMLGDISAGSGKPLNELVAIFAKIKNTGRLQGDTLAQLAEGGVPVYKALSKQMGVSTESIGQMVSEGKVSFAELETALGSLTAAGGIYEGMTLKQSRTLGGLWSTLTDTIGMSMADLVMIVVDAFSLRAGMTALTDGLAWAGAAVGGWVKGIAPIVKAFAVSAYQSFVGFYQAAVPILGRVYSFVSSIFGQLVPVVTGVATTLWTVASTTFTAIYNTVAPIVQTLYTTVASRWQGLLTSTITYGLAIWGAVQSAFGLVLDVANVMWNGVVSVWNWGASWITGSSTSAASTVSGVFAGVADVFGWVQEKVTAALNIASFAVDNWRDVFALAGTNVLWTVVSLGNQIAHVFTEVIPSILTWFGDNWKTILLDNFNYAKAFFTNIASNAVAILTNIPGLISGQMSFADLWTPLGEGFKSQLSEMPKIAEREIGGLEATLAASSASLANSLVTGYDAKIAEQKAAADAASKAITDGVTNAFKPPEKIDPPAVGEVKPPELPTIGLDAKVNQDNLTVGITPELKLSKMVMAGSAESQAMRFLSPDIAAALKGPATPVAGAAGSTTAPIAMDGPKQPTVEQSAGMKQTTDDFARLQLAELTKQSSLLKSIDDSLASTDNLTIDF